MRQYLIIMLFCLGSAPPAWAAGSTVTVLTLDDAVIDPVASEYILSELHEAEQRGDAAVVIELDTPGGLLASTRTIVKGMLNSKVPVIVYVAPAGARAGSAGVFITLAADVAAMAPSTNIGAAHPVEIGGGKPSRSDDWIESLRQKLRQRETEPGPPEAAPEETADPLSEKIMNDAVAWVTAIANHRGRNASWARRAVTESLSATEAEAVRLQVVDLTATDLADLLRKIPHRNLGGAAIVHRPMSARARLLKALINPNIAYLLMMLGFYGLLFEITHPGGIAPGILGAVCLVIALFAFQALPTNYAGLALIVIAFLFFLLEIKITSYGFLTLAGLASMVLGSLILFSSAEPFFRVSLKVILPVVGATGTLALFLISLAVRAQRQPPVTGTEGLIGQTAVAVEPLAREGRVEVQGELWEAVSDDDVDKGGHVVIVGVEGLKLKVRRRS